MPQPVRSILAVLSGFVAMMLLVVVLTLICIRVLHVQSGHGSSLYLVLNAMYTVIAAAAGGLIAARIARSSPLGHGIALGIMILLFGALSYYHSAAWQPLTYRVFMVLAPAIAAVGGARLKSAAWRR